jgi:hypothetical protein
MVANPDEEAHAFELDMESEDANNQDANIQGDLRWQ